MKSRWCMHVIISYHLTVSVIYFITDNFSQVRNLLLVIILLYQLRLAMNIESNIVIASLQDCPFWGAYIVNTVLNVSIRWERTLLHTGHRLLHDYSVASLNIRTTEITLRFGFLIEVW